MTAKRSPHYAAVQRARVRRLGDAHFRRNDIAATVVRREARRVGAALIDRPLTEAQKALRWKMIWGR